MNDQPEHDSLPDVLEANWDRDQIDALFSDLERGASVKHVQVRTASGVARDSAVTLQQAKQLLDEGAAKAIQIHYEFEGQAWCDTLIVSPAAVRVIRTAARP
jgi:hypothetical protein